MVKRRAIGPGPLRTARGAGRLGAGRRCGERAAGLRLLAAPFFGAGLRLGLVLRVAVLVPVFFAAPRVLLAARVEDVLLLRDPGGEDVRVAIPSNYTRVTPVTRTTGACRRRGSVSETRQRIRRWWSSERSD